MKHDAEHSHWAELDRIWHPSSYQYMYLISIFIKCTCISYEDGQLISESPLKAMAMLLRMIYGCVGASTKLGNVKVQRIVLT